MFPKRAVSSVTGLGGLAGALGSVILQSVAGVTIELTHGNYLPLFIVAACAYPLAILMIHLFSPRLEKVNDGALETKPMPRAVTAFVCAVLGFVVAVPLSFYFQGDNASKYRLYNRKTLVTMAVTEETDALPRDLFGKVDLKDADKPTTKTTLTLKREPKTPEETAAVEHVRAYQGDAAYELAQKHFPPGFTMGEYIAAVLPPGNIYTSTDRAQLLPPLICTPLVGAAVGAIAGAVVHGLVFRRKRSGERAEA
jgi:hypothetical protein